MNLFKLLQFSLPRIKDLVKDQSKLLTSETLKYYCLKGMYQRQSPKYSVKYNYSHTPLLSYKQFSNFHHCSTPSVTFLSLTWLCTTFFSLSLIILQSLCTDFLKIVLTEFLVFMLKHFFFIFVTKNTLFL